MNQRNSYITSKPSDYHPFGLRMWNRSSNSSLYKYGYQGSELDGEIKGEGNSYTTHFRLLDPRIGRWLSVDPKTSTSPWESPYVSMGNNPIWFNDVLGDKFTVGDKQAKSDVNSLAKKKNRKYIKYDDEGVVGLDFGDLNPKEIKKVLKRDDGIQLISNLVNAKDNEGNELNIFYGTEGPVEARYRESKNPLSIPIEFPLYPPGSESKGINDFSLNLSITPYSEYNKGILPKEGYDGQVLIAKGYPLIWRKSVDENNETTWSLLRVTRTRLIFHELSENYLRTVMGLYYHEAHKKAGGLSDPASFKFE